MRPWSEVKEELGIEVVMDAQEAILDITAEVYAERNRQDQKWGVEFPGRKDSFWYIILAEEFGEVAEAILKGNPEEMRTELIQCAAVIFAWLELRDGTPEDEIENVSEQ